MIVKDLDGNTCKWHIISKSKKRSRLQNRAHKVLRQVYPITHILEEVPIEIRKGSFLFLDIFIPLFKLAIEVQGKQHFSLIYHFHRNTNKFLVQKRNDRDKREWCQINGIKLIEWNYNEIEEQWIKKLKSEPVGD